MAEAAGVRLGERYQYEPMRIDGMDCPTCATGSSVRCIGWRA